MCVKCRSVVHEYSSLCSFHVLLLFHVACPPGLKQVAREFADAQGAHHFLTSAKKGLNVEKMFECIGA